MRGDETAPVYTRSTPEDVVRGTITTQNLVPAGTATANSAVEFEVGEMDTACIQVTGTYTGALSIQATVDGTTWVTLTASLILNAAAATYAATIASAATGLFQASVNSFIKIRVTGLAAMSGSAVITINGSQGNSFVAIDAPLPPGAATIGSVTIGSALPAGANSIGTVVLGAGAATIGNIGTIATSVTPGTAATNLGKAEDAVHTSGDVGVMALAVANTNAATAFSASGDYTPIAVDTNGALFTKTKPANTNGTPVAFALAANTSTSILASNAARRKALIVNRSGQTVFLRLGAAVTSSLYTWELAQGEKWELPDGLTGQIFALSTLAGSAVAAGVGLFVTEFTD